MYLFELVSSVSRQLHVKELKLKHSPIPYTKINSKWIRDLIVRPCNSQTPRGKENIGRILFDISCSNIFLDLLPRLMKIKAKINKWNLIKLKNFYTAKEARKSQKDNLQNERIYSQCDWQGMNLQNIQTAHIVQYQKNNQLKNGQKIKIDISPKKTYRWPTGTRKNTQHH